MSSPKITVPHIPSPQVLSTTESQVLSITQAWLRESVIKHQFCPYAKQPFDNNLIAYELYTGSNDIDLLEHLARCCIALDKANPDSLETTLLIISGHDGFLTDFDDYLDALDMANSLLDKPQKYLRRFSDDFQDSLLSQVPKQWSEHYQIASFHPQYCFANTAPDDKTNFTNRSPFPIFHLLRNDSIEKVRMNDDKADRIVTRNMQHIENMHESEFAKLVSLSKQAIENINDRNENANADASKCIAMENQLNT